MAAWALCNRMLHFKVKSTDHPEHCWKMQTGSWTKTQGVFFFAPSPLSSPGQTPREAAIPSALPLSWGQALEQAQLQQQPKPAQAQLLSEFSISFLHKFLKTTPKEKKNPGCSHQRGTIPVLSYFVSGCSSPSCVLSPSPFILNKKLSADQKVGRIMNEALSQEKKTN